MKRHLFAPDANDTKAMAAKVLQWTSRRLRLTAKSNNHTLDHKPGSV
jgi:hypothetical protein